MFVDDIRRALPGTPRAELTRLAATLWKAYAAGAIGEAETQQLAEEIAARKIIPPAPRPRPSRVGSRPRSSASMERRRRWAASGALPPQLAAGFTLGEVAVLAVVAAEVRRRGDCRLPVGHLAALAGVSPTTVRNALREARGAGLVVVEERRLSYDRSLPNIVRVVAPAWTAWMRLRRPPRPSGGGCRTVAATHTGIEDHPAVGGAGTRVWRRKEGGGGGGGNTSAAQFSTGRQQGSSERPMGTARP